MLEGMSTAQTLVFAASPTPTPDLANRDPTICRPQPSRHFSLTCSFLGHRNHSDSATNKVWPALSFFQRQLG